MLYDVQPGLELVGMSNTRDEAKDLLVKLLSPTTMLDEQIAIIEAYKDNAVEEAYKRGYIAGSIDQVTKKENN